MISISNGSASDMDSFLALAAPFDSTSTVAPFGIESQSPSRPDPGRRPQEAPSQHLDRHDQSLPPTSPLPAAPIALPAAPVQASQAPAPPPQTRPPPPPAAAAAASSRQVEMEYVGAAATIQTTASSTPVRRFEGGGGLYASDGNTSRISANASLYASTGNLGNGSMRQELMQLRQRRQEESHVLSGMEGKIVYADERLADIRSEIREEAAQLARDRVRRRQLMAVIDSIVSEAEAQRSKLLQLEQDDDLKADGGADGSMASWRFTPVAHLANSSTNGAHARSVQASFAGSDSLPPQGLFKSSGYAQVARE